MLDVLQRAAHEALQARHNCGTGYSSLEQLRIVPFDELKIDRGSHGAARDPRRRAIYDAHLELADASNDTGEGWRMHARLLLATPAQTLPRVTSSSRPMPAADVTRLEIEAGASGSHGAVRGGASATPSRRPGPTGPRSA